MFGITVHRLINVCWFGFKWGLILCVIGAALAVPYFYHRMDDEIRSRVEARIAAQYPALRVKIRSAVLVKGEGIEVRGLSILEPGAEGPGAELLNLDECFLGCSTDLQELLTGAPDVTRIVIRRPTLRVTRRPDGTWSAAKLLPLPRLSNHAPEVTVENGTIEVFDPLKTPTSTFTLRDVNLTMLPLPSEQPGVEPHKRKLQGTLSGDYFRQISFEGEVDPHRPDFAISGSTEGLEISPELRDALPGTWASSLAALGTFRGQGELRFQIGYDPASACPLQFDVSGRLLRGRVDDPRLPHPLTDIRALVHINNNGFWIDDLAARSNQATLRMACRGTGLGPSGPLAVEAEIRQLELDRQLIDALPDNLQEQWHKYRPEGQIDADVKLSYDGRTWTPQIAVRCLNVSFTYHKFPYRLEHGKGSVELKDNLLRANLTAYSGTQLVRVDAEVRNPLDAPCGWVEAKGDDLPLDQKLLVALSERSRTVARSLDLHGTVNFNFRCGRDAPEQPLHQHLVIGANGCALRYDKFPYSLANVRGVLEMRDGNWTFRGMEGSNGTGRVTCEGDLTAGPQGNQLSLRLTAKDVPLEEELRDALRPAMRQVWNMLRPRGSVDLTAELRYLDQTNELKLSAWVSPRTETTSVEPVAFPYRLEKLEGLLTYHDGQVTLERFKALHGIVKVKGNGSCSFLPDGGWRLHLEDLTVDRLKADRELMQAVPAKLKKALAELGPTGPISLRGSFDLARGGGPSDPVRSQWDLGIGLQQVGVDCGVRLDNINGSLSLAGGFDGQNFYSRGELSLDSLSYKDYQFTHVMGPFWIDDQQVLLGCWADQRQNEISPGGNPAAQRGRPLTAQLLGGKVRGNGWVALGPQPRYGVQAMLVDADLARLAQEAAPGHRDLRGRIIANVELGGNGRSRNALTGHGSIQLRDANVYELPVMIAMLKILSVRAPDPNAFSKSDVDYRIEGEHIYFDKLDFTGDAISLLGKGEMNFQSGIRLTFTAIMGRGELGMPALRQFFTVGSQQFMLIHVGGTLQNPETRKEPFPAVNQALQQLQNDINRK